MKSYALLMACTVVAGLSGNSFAALVGSSRPAAQENFQRLIQTNECPSCDLAGVVLTRVNLTGANLEGANLAGAKLFLADLSDANLRNANLQGAALGGADLAGADLRGANLTGAVLEGAYLKDAQIDGRIIADKPYEAEDLPGVSEKKYVADDSSSKNVPYTQEVVIDDRRDLSDAPAAVSSGVPGEEKEISAENGLTVDSSSTPSKTLVPMADVVVHSSAPDSVPEPEQISDPSRQAEAAARERENDTGLWGTVTSFFSSDSSEFEDESAAAGKTVAEPAVQESLAAPAQEIVPVKKVEAEPAAEEVAEAEPIELAEEKSTGEKDDESGFWGSVTSIFSSDDGQKAEQESAAQPNKEKTALTDEAAADIAAETGRNELAPDAEVLSMIEQIEGPPPETEADKVAAEDSDVQVVVADGSEEAASEGEKIVAEPAAKDVSPSVASSDVPEGESADNSIAKKTAEAADSPEPPAGASVSDMISQIEADQVTEAVPAGAVVYDVETPEQARAEQQMSVDRLLDDDRCVACDLAGVDLAGKNLGKVDLERANLQGANLEGVDLGEANLKGVDFSGANLKNADLREADLYQADFTGADLTGARLEEALVDSTVFTDAAGVNLEGTIKDE